MHCPCEKLGQFLFVHRMRPQEIIAKKRDGGELSHAEIDAFIDGVCNGSWADYQISALLMAMFTRGLDQEEQDALTYAMLHSGEVLDLSTIDKPKADKHSTGGVGDKTSLIIAPVLAACGVAVPMVSGRGLGHTGGTLDKLESIPGYRVGLTTERFREVIKNCGYAMSGQTDEVAPADKKLYALRDATSTVPYIPLIVASIMSKKLAEGLDALVLDVKTGNGAFMNSLEDSVRLAEALVHTGRAFDLQTQAIVSDMSRPLGKYVGNALEVYECIKILRGEVEPLMTPVRELSVQLSARVLVLCGISNSQESAIGLAESKIDNGQALETFRRNCELQGGDPVVCDGPERLLDDTILRFEITAPRSGFVAEADAMSIGEAVVSIGGGRNLTDDEIDPAVGFESAATVGDRVDEGDVLGLVYGRSEDQFAAVREKLRDAYKIAEEPVRPRELISAIV
jgi:pyrimidine-nucleoside phosphorylase